MVMYRKGQLRRTSYAVCTILVGQSRPGQLEVANVTQRRLRMLLVLAFPVALSLGILLIPVVSDYSDHAIAAQAVNSTGRWFAGHVLAAVAFGLSVVSVSVAAAVLADREQALPFFVLPLIAVGAGLYAAGLGADGVAPVALTSAGASPTVFFDGSGWWVSGIFMTATLFFGAGLIALTVHANRVQFVRGASRYLMLIAALLFMVIPAIQSGWGLYGEAIAAYLVFVPLALAVARPAQQAVRADKPRPR